jgi:NAD(P)-dependent dehydrogenase (short-subunit alcohol dehydrogenase family)
VGDVRDAAHVRAAVECALAAWGRIDIAVANAGTTGTVRIGEGSQAGGDDAWARTRAIVETNLLGTFHVFDAAAAAMGAGGRLIAISSVLGKLGAPGQAAYCASKAGVQGLVRAAAVELGPRSITCNAVCPGWVNTEMAQGRLAEIAAEAGQSVQAAEAAARAALPLGRFVTPEEVAGLVAFLCSAAAAAVTGQSLSICAGATAIGS